MDYWCWIISRSERIRNRNKKERFGDINDPDLKRDLASGQAQLISYTESYKSKNKNAMLRVFLFLSSPGRRGKSCQKITSGSKV
ncbi:MAG: hypothetical protein QOK79_11635 [Nitrososphaeraceae archaeon]|nr:hypothetical protein [Nitrososphaeraceae archaeon]MDW0214676.1 hypothetical protein [Nitrososphaeraceae archaeon]